MSLTALTLLAAATASPSGSMSVTLAMAQMQIAQLRIEQTTVVRVRPVAATAANQSLPVFRWEEKKGPNCIQVNSLAGALVSSPDSIDLLLRGGARLRAKLQKSCPAIDFYQGFYVKPSKDGRICQDRDTIHSRQGAECEIDKFKSLVQGKK